MGPVTRLVDDWQALCRERGEPSYRASQIFTWIHRHGVLDPDAMSNLPKSLRGWLADEGLAETLRVARVHRSGDDTRKLLVRLADGAEVETVLLPVAKTRHDADAAAVDDDDEEPDGKGVESVRVTQCISTQVGCAMGCVFCASGIAGLKRHLTADEIVAQVIRARAHLDDGEAIRNVVFMGMGEPLHNYDATAQAIRVLTHPDGLGLSPRRITVSTSGLVPQIDQLGRDFAGQVGLAISLHNPRDAERSALMPINDRYPLKPLLAALRRYPLPRGRRLTVEYTLVRGQNDSLETAELLARLLSGLRVKVNLIPMNPIEHSQLGPPSLEHVDAFQAALQAAGLLCFVRRRRGDDVSAACGQLVMLGAEPNRRFRANQPADRDAVGQSGRGAEAKPQPDDS